MRNKLAVAALFPILLLVIHFALQQESIYKATLGKFADTYQHVDGQIGTANIPYKHISNENILHWDAVHYHRISKKMYDVQGAGGDYIFAFFPLFPLIWKASMLPPAWVGLLNYVFFVAALLLITGLFSKKSDGRGTGLAAFTLALTMPTVMVFLIPYAEAVFMLTFAVAIAGMMKGRYGLYFAGALLASMTRPSIVIILVTFLATDLFFFLRHRSPAYLVKEFTLKALPVFAGTLAVSVIQLLQGSGSLLKFVGVQKYWGTKLSVPHNIIDWSHESFGLSIAVIFFIIAPVLAFILLRGASGMRSAAEPQRSVFRCDTGHKINYLFHLSAIYFLCMFFFNMLFNGGNVHSLYRYIACTPFFYIFLCTAGGHLSGIPSRVTAAVFTMLFFLSLFFMGLVPYSTWWNFPDTGYFLFATALMLWLLNGRYGTSLAYRFALCVYVPVSALWTTWMFDMLLADGWIAV